MSIRKLFCCLGLMTSSVFAFATVQQTAWPTPTGNRGGQHYSSLNQITPANVDRLKKAWVFHTGDVSTKVKTENPTTFETTPVLYKKSLIFCTPFNRVIALNGATGKELWSYNPHLDLSRYYGQSYLICRGVALWKNRVFTSAQDGRLIALDADTGQLVAGFGQNGVVDLNQGVPNLNISPDQYAKLGVTPDVQPLAHKIIPVTYSSTPAVINNEIIVGSSMADNYYQNIAPGLVRTYNAETGQLLWTFNPIPKAYQNKIGAANTWAMIATDAKNQLVFIATSSPSIDYYGVNRKAPIPYSTALIALNAKTGKVVWSQQLVHHNIYDYDLAAQPTLATIPVKGQPTPVVIEATKTGFIFVFNRLNGKPVFPIVEQPVPASDIPGEVTSPTQPFPANPAFRLLNGRVLNPSTAWGLTPLDRYWCKHKMESLRTDGLFTPASLKGSIAFPFSGGGVNWGGVAYDPNTQTLIANSSAAAQVVRLIPRAQADKIGYSKQTDGPGSNLVPAYGSPYAMQRYIFTSPLGVPCNSPAWGNLTAINLATGKRLWQVPAGAVKKWLGIRTPSRWGSPTIGGTLVTGSGLIFIGAGLDARLHAYDLQTGKALWDTGLPAVASATPMTYSIDGKQYVVIAAGGGMGSPNNLLGDSLVAYTLP